MVEFHSISVVAQVTALTMHLKKIVIWLWKRSVSQENSRFICL